MPHWIKMTKPKSNLVMAYNLKRRNIKAEPYKPNESLVVDDESTEALEPWDDLPEEEEQETAETRVARIMQNLRLSQLGNKSDD